MGRPPCDLEDYREWQKRLERFESTDLDANTFCLQEGISRSSLYRWQIRLKDGIPESMVSGAAESESTNSTGATFLPVSLKSPGIEIELPNGGVLRLPSDTGQQALVAIVKVVGSLRPWKAPES